MTALYHYTCRHGRAHLGYAGTVLPPIIHSPAAMADLQPFQRGLALLCWFTDLDEAIAPALGLTSATLVCDRTQYRYWVLNGQDVQPWLTSRFRRDPFLRKLELTPGAMPRHWWVADHGVGVALDRTWGSESAVDRKGIHHR